MSFATVDTLIYIFFALKIIVIILAGTIFLLGIDDLFIDIVYWARRCFRHFRIYDKHAPADQKRLYGVPEKPLAIMVPAWQEVGVVGEMARLAAATLDYENYQIFVGTYPNDPETQHDVDEVCAHFPNVHKVVCVRPGPTSKADCLNNIIDAILTFEAQANIQFAGFILHDAEDVISPLELRLFNYLLPKKDLIQVPVYPYPPKWWGFTAGHYADEFAEYHGKDVIVREALSGQVPSAGVGTCFSRRAIVALLEDGDGIAFDVQSLTEDYDIGFRLKQKGMVCIFARFSVSDPSLALKTRWMPGMDDKTAQVICVREHFPRSFGHAVRQKSRWITGIVFQGTSNLGWSRHGIINYFLWRDRRGLLTNLLGLMVNVMLLILLTMWLITTLVPDSWRFPSILGNDPLLHTVLLCNGFLLLNRLLQRSYFVTRFYGIHQGLLSVPRVVWSNLINFCANVRALRQVVKTGDSRRVAWDKTSHEFPTISGSTKIPIGQRLIQKGLLTPEQLEAAITSPYRRRLGRELMLRGLINSTQLTEVLAEQANMEWGDVNPFAIAPELIKKVPGHIALRYAVIPCEQQGDTLILASERPISQVSLGAISRKLKQPVSCRLVPHGRVTLALRNWYSNRHQNEETRTVLEFARANCNNPERIENICLHQVMLGELLQVRGIVSASLFNQAMIDYDPEKESLGAHLVARGIITRERLEQALKDQENEQHAAYQFAREAA
ncbi:cyclic di-3',5'-guanylate-activated glycosyltransferase NrfB [Thalassospira sp. TSL5-1]|uniref:cyclic di-3',5'-guanylate-activated glycosyltransferase NfrB n=1 Tax=Thalassospira sp. TSL5-1 TaxID=1544451 RepID=UPI00093E4750|nr:cyclic di-3',5'-guanylate-activated glycosyltransferase NrfB [Thalassospira sp. TSL5-1]OKH86398.1 bacteriophage N4 adsorption protein B [Thalassospira sp. TSL5-1]